MQFYLANSLNFFDYVTQIIITIITMKGEKRSKFSFHELLVPLQREIEIRSGILLAALHMQCFCLYTQREVTMPDNTQQLRDPRSYQKLLLLLHLHNMVFSPYVVLLQTPHNQTLVVPPQQSYQKSLCFLSPQI